MLFSENPTTGERLQSYEPLTADALEAKLRTAVSAFDAWRATSFQTRARLVGAVADYLDAHAGALAELMTREMGKPLAAARSEVAKCALGCRFYAAHGAGFLAPEIVPTDAAESRVVYEPMGPILAIMPWNFPFWQVFRFAAPALMAGNVALLKHAPNVLGAAAAIEAAFTAAGFPPGVFQSLVIDIDRVPALLDDPRVAAVTLTGSDRAGRDVAARAGHALKKSVLELGGSDPFIVMGSANLDEAVRTGVRSRTLNNGQSCISAKRFIVAEPVADAFERAFVAQMAALRIGDPMDAATDVGPLARSDLRDLLDRQVRETVAAGARVLLGGAPLDRPGYFYAPTVLTDIPHGSPAYRDELFGPVASLFRVRDAAAALALANDSRFGLGASVWTTDAAERDRFVAGLAVGQVFVNAMVASDPRLPFGGVKTSGYGRELGVLGIREFVHAKTVWVA
jgi:succinate-semialdehyde dehydrogenase/glutarate-semialdehyde dehydrogenase